LKVEVSAALAYPRSSNQPQGVHCSSNSAAYFRTSL